MTVGKALAEARTRAGLTLGEVSERTKIRETVIRGVERDDYEACGGDLFARGYVRCIAGVVGVDAQPLIREYDKSHKRGQAIATVIRVPEKTAPEAPPAPEPSAPEAAPVEAEAPAAPEAEPEPDLEPESEFEPGPERASEPEQAEPAQEQPEPEPEQEPTPEQELEALRAEPETPAPLIQPGPRLHPSLTRRDWRYRLRSWFRARCRELMATSVP